MAGGDRQTRATSSVPLMQTSNSLQIHYDALKVGFYEGVVSGKTRPICRPVQLRAPIFADLLTFFLTRNRAI